MQNANRYAQEINANNILTIPPTKQLVSLPKQFLYNIGHFTNIITKSLFSSESPFRPKGLTIVHIVNKSSAHRILSAFKTAAVIVCLTASLATAHMAQAQEYWTRATTPDQMQFVQAESYCEIKAQQAVPPAYLFNENRVNTIQLFGQHHGKFKLFNSHPERVVTAEDINSPQRGNVMRNCMAHFGFVLAQK